MASPKSLTDPEWCVYILYGQGGRPLYVGKTSDIRRRAREHHRDKEWWDRVVDVGWEDCETESEALFREAELIDQYRPMYNIMGNPSASNQHGGRQVENKLIQCRVCGKDIILSRSLYSGKWYPIEVDFTYTKNGVQFGVGYASILHKDSIDA